MVGSLLAFSMKEWPFAIVLSLVASWMEDVVMVGFMWRGFSSVFSWLCGLG